MTPLFSYTKDRNFISDQLTERTKKNPALSMHLVSEEIGMGASLSANLKELLYAKKMIRDFIETFSETFEKDHSSELFHLKIQNDSITKNEQENL